MATSAAPTAAPKPTSPVIFQGSQLTLVLQLDNVALETFVKAEVSAEIQRQVAAALTVANASSTIP